MLINPLAFNIYSEEVT